jgi:lipopolysaccharide/colanic/teichoic acid biosynthesis glycosyltransferase
MKRVFDVLLSALLLVLLSPLLAIAAAAIAIESGTPILFRQTRLGQGGREFAMYKFRSMVRDAEAVGPYFTSAADPRITRVGAFIRRTSLDELPQLFNVIKGDMSLVGPRPAVPAQRTSVYTEQEWEARCAVRPGITGLAQALVRSTGTQQECTMLDLRYAREASLWLDLKIVAWTIRTLLSGNGN